MTVDVSKIAPDGFYELRDAAAALEVSRMSIIRWTKLGMLSCSLRKMNNRQIWRGSELIRFWNDKLSY